MTVEGLNSPGSLTPNIIENDSDLSNRYNSTFEGSGSITSLMGTPGMTNGELLFENRVFSPNNFKRRGFIKRSLVIPSSNIDKVNSLSKSNLTEYTLKSSPFKNLQNRSEKPRSSSYLKPEESNDNVRKEDLAMEPNSKSKHFFADR